MKSIKYIGQMNHKYDNQFERVNTLEPSTFTWAEKQLNMNNTQLSESNVLSSHVVL